MKTIITCAAIGICNLTGLAPALADPSPAHAQFNETAMIFWTVCDSIPMFETEHNRRPKSKEEILKYLGALGASNPKIKQWVDVLKKGDFTVKDPEVIQDGEVYISFKADKEKKRYVLLKNGKMKTLEEAESGPRE
jgi:hypothetical protein